MLDSVKLLVMNFALQTRNFCLNEKRQINSIERDLTLQYELKYHLQGSPISIIQITLKTKAGYIGDSSL